MALITVFGIPNCDTVKRARAWLDANGTAHTFHDFKKHGLPADALDAWLVSCGWEALLNRRGTTWRALSPAAQQQANDRSGARALMLAQPSVIKRPVVQWAGGTATVGFDADDWIQRL